VTGNMLRHFPRKADALWLHSMKNAARNRALYPSNDSPSQDIT
jgi:hypothetical protein